MPFVQCLSLQDQYVFLFNAVRELLLCGDTTVHAINLRKVIVRMKMHNKGGFREELRVCVGGVWSYVCVGCVWSCVGVRGVWSCVWCACVWSCVGVAGMWLCVGVGVIMCGCGRGVGVWRSLCV